MNLSILQGRLSMPILGYQETPEDWQREFNLIGDLGINHIEWVVTNKQYFNNPIFSDDLSGYPISIVCADNAVDERIFEKGYFFDTIFPLCEMCQENGLTTVGIPLLEKSSVNSKNKKDSIIQNLIDCCDAFPSMTVNLEAELDADTLLDIVNSHENLKITYDTGNITSMNFDHKLYIEKVFDKITNVHLKDRCFDGGPSMHFGKGDTNFELIFEVLSNLGYDKIFTLQMRRGEAGNEVSHIKEIATSFRRLYDKYF